MRLRPPVLPRHPTIFTGELKASGTRGDKGGSSRVVKMTGGPASQNKNSPRLYRSVLLSYNTGGPARVAPGCPRDVMAKSIRLTTVLTLLVTFLVAGLL